MEPRNRHILVIETSSRVGTAALAGEAGVVVARQLPGTMRHAGELMPAIDALLKAQGWPAGTITDVFVSIGPGSFTGLRVGVTVARTLAWSIGARVVAVPTVDSLALNGLEARPCPTHLAVLLDAKQSRVFAAAFELLGTAGGRDQRRGPVGSEGTSAEEQQTALVLRDGAYQKLIDAHLAEPREFLSRCPKPLAILGEGIPYHRQAIDESGATVLPEPLWSPRVEHVYLVGKRMADAGHFTLGADLLPLYIRRPEAEEKWEKLHGPGGRRVT